MRKALAKVINDEICPEYDLSQLKGGVRGKYYQQAKAGTNLVLIEPDLAWAFPSEEMVNRALRLLLAATNFATIRVRQRRAAPNKALNRTRKKQRAG